MFLLLFFDETTKGVLSGEKQRVARGYDFVNVCHWFAERADLILLLFDAHKLDISDEFKAVIERLKGQDDKIRVILNKADQARCCRCCCSSCVCCRWWWW